MTDTFTYSFTDPTNGEVDFITVTCPPPGADPAGQDLGAGNQIPKRPEPAEIMPLPVRPAPAATDCPTDRQAE